MITVDSDDESPDKEEQLGKGKKVITFTVCLCSLF